MFSVVWTILKTAISSHTKTKIHMLGSDYHESIEQFIDNDMLPIPLQRQGTRRVVTPIEESTVRVTTIEQIPISTTTASVTTSVDTNSVSKEIGAAGRQSYTPSLDKSSSRSPPKERKVSSFLSSKLSRIKSKECSSVILSISEVEYSIDSPPSCNRLTVRAKDQTATTRNSKIISEDSQELQLPLTSKRFFVLSLDSKVIVDNMLTLDFELGLNGGNVSVHSKLQVFIHPNIAIESLLCWVTFYDQYNQSMCLLKVVLSYQPQKKTSSKSKFNKFFSSKSSKKKEGALDQLMFRAQQVITAPPVVKSSASIQEGGEEDAEEEEEDDDEEDEDDKGTSPVLTMQALEAMEQQEAVIDMDYTEMFTSFFQVSYM